MTFIWQKLYTWSTLYWKETDELSTHMLKFQLSTNSFTLFHGFPAILPPYIEVAIIRVPHVDPMPFCLLCSILYSLILLQDFNNHPWVEMSTIANTNTDIFSIPDWLWVSFEHFEEKHCLLRRYLICIMQEKNVIRWEANDTWQSIQRHVCIYITVG